MKGDGKKALMTRYHPPFVFLSFSGFVSFLQTGGGRSVILQSERPFRVCVCVCVHEPLGAVCMMITLRLDSPPHPSLDGNSCENLDQSELRSVQCPVLSDVYEDKFKGAAV